MSEDVLSMLKCKQDVKVYLEIFNIIRWVAGLMGRRLIDQEYDVPSIIIFFQKFLQNSLQQCFHFLYILNFTKIKRFVCKSKPAAHCFIFNLSK